MLRTGLKLLLVLAASAAMGVGNGLYRGVPVVPDVQQVKVARDAHAVWVQETGISLADFISHYQAGKLVIDARFPEEFEAGHLDAPLIMNVPAEEADQHLERALAFIGTPIVLYCSSEDCESAETLWIKMRSWAFPPNSVRVFHGGWMAIVEEKLPTTRGPDMFHECEPPDDQFVQDSASDADLDADLSDPGSAGDEADVDAPGDDGETGEEGDNS